MIVGRKLWNVEVTLCDIGKLLLALCGTQEDGSRMIGEGESMIAV